MTDNNRLREDVSKELNTTDSVSSTKEEKDLSFGCCSWKPSYLQWWNNIVGAVTFISLANCMQGFSNGLLGVSLSTLEKQFDLSSTASSWIASAYEIGPIPLLFIYSYLGNRVHRPRHCAVGLLGVTIGSILFFIPQFTSPVYVPSTSTGIGPENSLCSSALPNGTRRDPCEEGSIKTDSLSYYLPVFIIARLLIGFGATPIFTLGVTFIEDCAIKEKFSTYAGVYLAASIIGPTLAFIGGAAFLSIFVDFYSASSKDIDIEPSDPRWIGAWWLSYILAAGLNFFNALPMFGYASDLPGAEELRSKKISEAHTQNTKQEANQQEESFVETFKSVFKNPTWMMLTIYTSCDNFIIAGYTAFGPKLIEVMFSLSASLAGVLFGILLLPAGAGGTIIGGLIVEKCKLSCKQIIRIETVFAALVTLGTACFLLTCEQTLFAGVSVSYNLSESSSYNLTDTCNVACECSGVVYEPICSVADNVQYYSPCHAACSFVNETAADELVYYDCSCISRSVDQVSHAAVWGPCSGDLCPNAIIFLVAFFFAVLFIFMAMTMNMTATLRCVKRSESTLAISIQVLFIKLLGMMPGPIIIGLSFDATCELWQNDCDVKGSCMLYHIENFARSQFYICFAVKVISLIVSSVAMFVYKPPKIQQSVEGKLEVTDSLELASTSNGSLPTTSRDEKELDLIEYSPTSKQNEQSENNSSSDNNSSRL